jgi:RNA polymerase-binding protein DksA
MASRTSTVAAGARRVIRAVAAVAAGRTPPVTEPVSKAAPARKTAATRKRSAATRTPGAATPAKKTANKAAKKTAKKASKKTAEAATATTNAAAGKAAPTKTSTSAPTKAASKRAQGTTSTATKAAATKAAATKAPVKKATTKKATTKKATTKKAPATKAPATKASSWSSSRAATLRVREDESPWTPKELREVRSALESEVERLSGEISQAESGLQDLLRDSGDGAGDDQADAGAKTFEREQEITLANNSREMLLQTERALARIADGSYGECESCGNPIGKLRLQVFPRATLCVTCKQRQERR